MDGLALLLWAAPAVIEPLALAFAAWGLPEVADASPFGRAGTVVVAVSAAVLSALAAILAWRGISGALRGVTAVLLTVVTVLVGLMTVHFFFSGAMFVAFGILLLHATISICVLTQAVLQAAPSVEGADR
ncbi:hypothetical protein Are01nite_10950 [Actinoplanes regularis]|nr:hypothetical protein Are01nite_10950 [Actinoplanes regularis]